MPWNETTVTRELVETKPAPAAITSRREVPGVGVTIVRFANGVEAWLKPTDFKNDQVLFDHGGAGRSLAGGRAPICPRRRSRPPTSGLSGVGGLKALDLQRMLAGQARLCLARTSACRNTAFPAAHRPRSSKRRCNCSI